MNAKNEVWQVLAIPILIQLFLCIYFQWSYALLLENDIADKYFYLIRVHTGIRRGSGTKSNVGFVLVGENGDTGIRIMDDVTHMVRNTTIRRTLNVADMALLLCYVNMPKNF